MDKIKEIALHLEDGSVKVYKGRGLSHEINTTKITEAWVRDSDTKPETTVEPLRYLYIQFVPEVPSG